MTIRKPTRRKAARIRPVDERFAPDATGRGPALALSPSERETIYRIDLSKKALLLLVEQSKSFPKVAEELGLKVEELVEYSDTIEFQAFKRAMVEKVATMYLDPERAWTRAEMAEALGITSKRFRNLIHSEEFRQVYEEVLLKLTEDPGPRAVQAKIIEELLPTAYTTLMWELSAAAPPTVRQNARRDVFKLAGVEQVQNQASDRHEIAAFLAAQNVGTMNVNVVVPPEYQTALKDYLGDGQGVVDGEYTSTPDHADSEGDDRSQESTPDA